MRGLPTLRQIVNWIKIHIEDSAVGEACVACSVLDRSSVQTIKDHTGLHCYFDYYKEKFLFSKEELSDERCEDDNLTLMK